MKLKLFNTAILFLVAGLNPLSVHASEGDGTWRFIGGVTAGFLGHETSHLLMNLAFGNRPTIKRVNFLGVIPFVAIDPEIHCWDGVCVKANGEPFTSGPAGKIAITTAGFHFQHLSSEFILTDTPDLRNQDAPFRKGLLAFNVLTSVTYSVAHVLALEPSEGDVSALGPLTGAPRGVLALMLLTPAALDLARYLHPDLTWIPWVSRTLKTAEIGVTFAF